MLSNIPSEVGTVFGGVHVYVRLRACLSTQKMKNKKLSYRKESVRLLHNIEIRILH